MPRIEDYALIGDLHTTALVARQGSIDWLCLPRVDSPACFASLLDDHRAGCWQLAPSAGESTSTRRYREGTLILETDWVTPDGSVRVVDFMPPRQRNPHVVRIVVGLTGSVAMRGTVRLRFDYGSITPWVTRRDGGIRAVAGPDAVWLRTPAPLQGQDLATVSEFIVRAGEQVPFVLSWSQSWASAPAALDPSAALGTAQAFWDEWSHRAEGVDGPYRDAVMRSLITLKALTYQPTGGIVAAATTSLPELLGGSRNWDYRYCWLRDATYTLQALIGADYLEEAKQWREWLLRAIAGDPADLQIMYGVDGTRRLAETELPWLRGYQGSAPVRIGNAASGQLQLDVWGEVLDGLGLARDSGLTTSEDAWDLQCALLEHLEGLWRSPDNGIWEIRGPQRHFTHSKVMAWVAADRMVKAVQRHGLAGPVRRWRALREQIHADVLANAIDPSGGNFVQSYGSTQLDAALLMIGRVGFLPPDDARVLATIDAVQGRLMDGGLVRRYDPATSDDGLEGGEGAFLACSFWLVDALHAAGRTPAAVELFEHLLSLRNDVGLLAEQWDVKGDRQLGNFPQAFSHFPLIVSALQLHAGRGHRSDEAIARS